MSPGRKVFFGAADRFAALLAARLAGRFAERFLEAGFAAFFFFFFIVVLVPGPSSATDYGESGFGGARTLGRENVNDIHDGISGRRPPLHRAPI